MAGDPPEGERSTGNGAETIARLEAELAELRRLLSGDSLAARLREALLQAGRRDETELVPEDQLPASTAHAATDAPLRMTLEKAVAALRPRHRDVFLLFEVEDFLHREIAEILDIAEGTSKSLLFEARRELQSTLGDVRGRQA